ncbi:MAG TPA: UDP-galactopyranose mutase [Spirochaetales bacterium]|nr:UDP-galactopyranose mutase [Spirochaetales bacterium]
MKYDCLVVGAGFAGCAAARLLAESGRKVLVVERLKHLAGHSHDYRNEYGIFIHSYGPHIFHTNNQEVWQFVNRFTRFHNYQHRVLSYIQGRLLPFPINLDTLNEVFDCKLKGGEAREFLRMEAAKAVYNQPPENFRDVVVSQVGEYLYELFFKNYTIKQWQKDPEEILPEVALRIPVRENRDDRYFTDKHQGIPASGYTDLAQKILNHRNIELSLETDYFDIRNNLESRLTVYTGELDRFFDYKYGRLQYRSLDFKYETLDQEFFQPAAVVNYPNDHSWTRITEYKYFLGEKTWKTTISYEFPKATGEPYYVVMSGDNVDKRKLYQADVDKLNGKYLFLGRLAEYKYYNMDQVVEMVINRIGEYLKR